MEERAVWERAGGTRQPKSRARVPSYAPVRPAVPPRKNTLPPMPAKFQIGRERIEENRKSKSIDDSAAVIVELRQHLIEEDTKLDGNVIHRPTIPSTVPQTIEELVSMVSGNNVEKENICSVFQQQEVDWQMLLGMRDQQVQKMKGISEQAKTEILELLAKVKAQGERAVDFTSWDEEGVVNWLQRNGWHQFAEKFRQAKITGLSLIFLTESDLEHNIGIAAFGTRKKISKELEALRSRNPTALDKFVVNYPWLKKQELISVPLESISADFFATKGHGWDQLASNASSTIFSPVLAFAGPTGVGKSRLLSALLPFDSRMQLCIPLVAAEGQRQSTTGNLSLYKGSLVGSEGNRPVYLLDLEGENGTLPKEMEQEATQFMSWLKACKDALSSPRGTSTTEKLKGTLAKRMAFVKNELPKIAYLISNIIIYVDRQPMHNTTYMQKVRDFSQRASPGGNAGDRPHLIFVQNFCSDSSDSAYKIDRSTAEFTKLLENEGELDTINSNFSSFAFIKIPDMYRSPDVFGEQISSFQQNILEKLQSSKDSFMLDPGNFFTEHHWFKAVENIMIRLGQREESINMAQVFLTVCKPKDDLLNKAMCFFNAVYDTLYIRPTPKKTLFSSGNLKEFTDARLLVFQECLTTTLFKMATLFAKEWKEQKIVMTRQHLKMPQVRLMLNSHFDMLYELLMKRAPCAYMGASSYCIHERMVHGKQHRLFSPVLRGFWQTGKNKDSGFQEPKLVFSKEEFCNAFLDIAGGLLQLTEHEFHVMRVQKLQKLFCLSTRMPEIQQKIKELHVAECLICLEHPATVLLRCGHTICRTCHRLSEELPKLATAPPSPCPFCGEEVQLLGADSVPKLARPRLLTLDGGGLRSLVMLKVLHKVEDMLNLKLSKLFDFIGGTSSGALLAHGLGIEEQSVERCEALVLRISKMLYRQSLLPKIVREAIVGDYDKPMLEVLNDVFSDKTFMDVATKSPKVMIVTNDVDENKEYIFGSYAAPHVNWTGEVITSLLAAISVPGFLPFVVCRGHRLSDAGLVANNPSLLAHSHAQALWGRPPSLILSLGPGLSKTETPAFAEKHQGGIGQMLSQAGVLSEIQAQQCNKLCLATNVPCYWRLAPQDLGDIGYGDTSKAARKQIQRKAEEFCEQNQTMIKQIRGHLLSQLFYLDDAVGNSIFLILCREPSHFTFDNDIIKWKDANDVEQEAILYIEAINVITQEPLALGLENIRQHWAVKIKAFKQGEYQVRAFLSLPHEGERYPIAGSPCFLWLDGGAKDNFQATLSHRWHLAITIDRARLPCPASYCTLRYAGETKTSVKKTESVEPEWQQQFDFFSRKQPQSLVLEVDVCNNAGQVIAQTTWLMDDVQVENCVTRCCKCACKDATGLLYMAVRLSYAD